MEEKSEAKKKESMIQDKAKSSAEALNAQKKAQEQEALERAAAGKKREEAYTKSVKKIGKK